MDSEFFQIAEWLELYIQDVEKWCQENNIHAMSCIDEFNIVHDFQYRLAELIYRKDEEKDV